MALDQFLDHATAPRIDVWRPLVQNVPRRFGDFCAVLKPFLCTARPEDRTLVPVLSEIKRAIKSKKNMFMLYNFNFPFL